MNILLDSHTLIWFSQNSPQLSSSAIKILEDRNNLLFLSLVSVWEIQIKVQLGKLNLDISLSEIVKDQTKINDVQILPLKLSHIWTLDTLPYYHKDPFDRLLISQAITENLIILGVDPVFDSYPVQKIW
ncbi:MULTISPECIES: type II toxin-antitoxin system VapC family toxin [unclassified Microcystis]|jgi:PIN domain nuclease of toxin-antitoxin system|uniref:type II toxin-antitoxin system VapC family toxin n=1 Tax=unclassified Microcystis TaxID=2643300 RepID=UPI0022CBA9E3|nr:MULTISPECIES: type II toxin-antitoxin system VapC family toxin [unclassified Microcystis]MCA2692008.1 type II toxin-antitoxin system VapC family toxin [Microcystis sp. M034S2]MCA2752570.1 type II toxin-antitoxin system VapC family toxin [Microcystis sp. M144S2]MCZ8200213.1 type II toxin-antitoxin system VapC family toxin [Microcystis sp. LE19-55.1A]MCZ8308641.1 type II toxin-antitoxin system VapC family toxin [Microcystis sp. LE19-98.1E]